MQLVLRIWIRCSNMNQVVVTVQPHYTLFVTLNVFEWYFSVLFSCKNRIFITRRQRCNSLMWVVQGQIKVWPWAKCFNANVMPNTMMNNNVSYVIILSCMFWTSPVPAFFIPPVLSWVKNSNNLKLSLLMQVEQVERLYPTGICEHQQVKILGIIHRYSLKLLLLIV